MVGQNGGSALPPVYFLRRVVEFSLEQALYIPRFLITPRFLYQLQAGLCAESENMTRWTGQERLFEVNEPRTDRVVFHVSKRQRLIALQYLASMKRVVEAALRRTQ